MPNEKTEENIFDIGVCRLKNFLLLLFQKLIGNEQGKENNSIRG